MSHLVRAVIFSCVGILLSGCAGLGRHARPANVDAPAQLETKYFASDEDVQAGARHFEAGAFGLAQKSFQAAVEKSPNDPVAWMGLAASYDRLRRFDLADRAYTEAERLEPNSPDLFNNRGYSYLLRGETAKAREFFMVAYSATPQEPTFANNLHLLDGSSRFVRRQDAAY